MDLTPYHAKYFAHELTKRCPSDSVEKLAEALIDAQVDLNPHQVEAALFAFSSPLSKEAVLADEVGLGKMTHELIMAMADRKSERVVCVDAGFAGNDQPKTNAVQTMKAKGVTSFKTV